MKKLSKILYLATFVISTMISQNLYASGSPFSDGDLVVILIIVVIIYSVLAFILSKIAYAIITKYVNTVKQRGRFWPTFLGTWLGGIVGFFPVILIINPLYLNSAFSGWLIGFMTLVCFIGGGYLGYRLSMSKR